MRERVLPNIGSENNTLESDSFEEKEARFSFERRADGNCELEIRRFPIKIH